nr:MAG TPA: hypothetical protein [Caudoviricetes sp.]DAX78479.1 MAG TPA: hypothetical protein [Caudoviricetes sp.]
MGWEHDNTSFQNGIDMGSKKRTKTAWFSFYLT